MAQTATPKLDQGDQFPNMSISMVDGTTLNLPTDLSAELTIFLGYRGKW
ncbi:MAG: hypothetical protein AAF702_23355 [Chloroflexota bacterium]